VLVTGGSRGLGAATSRRLARMGARVVVTYRNREDEAAVVVADCEAHTPGARAEQLDLLEEASVRALFERITERDGHLDVVVANAAATAFKPLLELKLHQIDKTFAISVRHFLLLAQLAFPLLQPRGGRIVAISGADTVGYIPGHGLLAAAKSGMGDHRALPRLRARAPGRDRRRGAARVRRHRLDQAHDRAVPRQAGRRGGDDPPAADRGHPGRRVRGRRARVPPEARWLNGQIVQNDGAGLFAYMGRFGQAWAMVPDEAVMPDTSDAPMLRSDG
jgi:NAD(P)-dependent dehydrogenase (short-subunit alcohol dehydrogenase family)